MSHRLVSTVITILPGQGIRAGRERSTINYGADVRAVQSEDGSCAAHASGAQSYFTSERRSNSSPMTSGSRIQMAVVEPSMAHSLAVSVPPSNSATCV